MNSGVTINVIYEVSKSVFCMVLDRFQVFLSFFTVELSAPLLQQTQICRKIYTSKSKSGFDLSERFFTFLLHSLSAFSLLFYGSHLDVHGGSCRS